MRVDDSVALAEPGITAVVAIEGRCLTAEAKGRSV
jgi:DNA primase